MARVLLGTVGLRGVVVLVGIETMELMVLVLKLVPVAVKAFVEVDWHEHAEL